MLYVHHELVQKIARTRARHTWAKKIMLLPIDEAEKAEARVLEWITQVVQKRFPGADDAERMVRDYWLHVLECDAIDKFTDKNPRYQSALPTLISGQQAVMYAEADLMWPNPKQGEIAARILDEIKAGKLKPDMDYILGLTDILKMDTENVCGGLEDEAISRTSGKHVEDTGEETCRQNKLNPAGYIGEIEKDLTEEDLDKLIQQALDEIKEILSQSQNQENPDQSG